MSVLKKLDLPPVWALVTALSAWALAYSLPILRFDFPILPWVFVAVGLLIVLGSAGYFFQHKTPIEPRKTPKTLIVEGPYRINRNPIYTGMTLILVGIALGLGAISAFIPVLAYPFLLTERFILGEEAGLRSAFGDAAESYLAASRRW